MPLFRTFFITALFSLATSYAHACGVDSVAGKTDTSITIAWDVNCNKFLKVEICWKLAANSGNVCNPPAMAFYTTTGSYTIAGLQPQTPYKIKTHWRTQNSAWKEITTRTVTTNPSPGAAAGYLTIYNTPATSVGITINAMYVVVNNDSQHNTGQLPITPQFTTFVLVVPLGFHWQSWTFTAKLYRDNTLVDTLSGKSPWGSSYDAVATFAQQPNAFVHGHVWKIVWAFRNKNGTSSYSIP